MAFIPHRQTGAKSSPGRAPFRLTTEILKRSVADNWHEARKEWRLSRVTRNGRGHCACGHVIANHHIIVNKLNGAEMVVGSYCVRVVMNKNPDAILANLREVKADPMTAPSAAAAQWVHEQGWIDDWQLGFCEKTRHYCRLTPRQDAKRLEISRRVIDRLADAGKEMG